MKIDDKEQLQSFMNNFRDNGYTEEELKQVEQIIDIDRIQTFSKKLLLLQWYFFQDTEYYESDSQMYQNALDKDLKNGLIQKLSIEFNIGLLKDDWGKENARTEMGKLAKEGLLIRKDIKNYIITNLGEECAKFIYFKILESLIGIHKLWKLIKLDLTSDNLQKLDSKITRVDLENWFIIKIGAKFSFHEKFVELIEFIKRHPELYPQEFIIIKENLISWLINSLINELDKKNARLTISGKQLHSFKENLDKIDWIFKIKCTYNRREIKLLNWATNDNYKFITYDKEGLNAFLNRFCVLLAPAGYGKSILLNQFVLELLTAQVFDKFKIIPLYISLEKLQLKDGKILVDDKLIIDAESLSKKEFGSKELEALLTTVINVCLSYYNTNEFMLKIFYSVLKQTRILLVLDGWDELSTDLQIFFSNILKSIINKNFNSNIKILISSRYSETSLNSIFPRNLEIKNNKIAIGIKIPEEDDIDKYLGLVISKENISELKDRFRGSLSPLNLFLLGIFPHAQLPKFKTQLFERWIYFQILTDVLSPEEFIQIKNNEDIRVKLESIKIPRELDNQSYYLSQYIGGNVKGSDNINYAVLEILPRIAYSVFHPNLEKPISYLEATMNNPLLKRFISPYYKGFQRYARLIDPHFYPYFIAKLVFSQFLDDKSLEPIPYSEIEELLIDLFNQHKGNPKIKELGISKPEYFPYYLYLQSGIILPALRLPYYHEGSYSVPLSWTLLRYGVYLLKAFQSEFKKAMKFNNSVRKSKILRLFEIFEKKRPTKTFGSYMDEYSHDTEIGEPSVNHYPLDYFNTIVQLLDLDTFSKKTGVEIKYLKVMNEYYMKRNLDFGRGYSLHEADENWYWKKNDLSKIINKIFESENVYLLPWYARIFSSFKSESEIEINLDDDQILTKYKSSEDSYIKESLLKILILNNPKKALGESDLFISKPDDINNLERLVYNFIEHLAEKVVLSREEFQIWLKYYQHPSNTIKLKYILTRFLYNINLNSDQVSSLWSLAINEHKVSSGQILEDYYYSIEEDPEELPFILNCLILLNYNRRIKKPDYYYNDILIEKSFLLKYVFTKRRFCYIKLLRDSEYISSTKLSDLIKRIGFSYIFSYSSEVFQNLWYDYPYFQTTNKFLEDTYGFLIQIQKEWWNQHKPSNYHSLKPYLVEIFKFYKENEGKWDHVTNLGNAYVHHKKEEIQPEIIQMTTLLDLIDIEFPEFKKDFVHEFFNLIEEHFLTNLEGNENDIDFSFFKPDLPSFIRLTFKRLKEEDSDIWRKLLELYKITEVSKKFDEELVSNEEKNENTRKIVRDLVSPQEIDKLLNIRSIRSQFAKKILDCIIPDYYIDSWGEDNYEIPEKNREYQKKIFWFLISLLRKKINIADLNTELEYYRNSNNPLLYLKRLILYGIQENKINRWYGEKPKIIPIDWIQKNIDPLIVKHVFFPDQIEFIPKHLKINAHLHAWKYILLPDLVNKLEQYFGTHRESFPFSEYEKSYITEDDDFSGFYSGIS